MSLSGYNELHLQQLAEAARRDGLAVLVGAGSSIACGYPGWDAFISRLRQPLERRFRKDYLAELAQRTLRTQLDEIASGLADDYPRIFEETFRPRRESIEAPEWVKLIYDLPPRLLLTTNYTTELEWAGQFTHAEPVRWHDAKAVSRALKAADGRRQVIYLHGRYDDHVTLQRDPEGREWSQIVLGEKSYNYAYAHPGTIRKRFSAVCQTNTLLVLGASFQDEAITGTLATVGALSGGDVHYAIMALPKDRSPDAEAAEYIARYRVQPLFYETIAGDHADPLAALLRNLVERAAPPLTRRDVPPPERATPRDRPPWPRVVHPLLRATAFEPRPLYSRVIETFVAGEQGGVLALVGMGGTGKTALARESLEPALKGTLQPALAGLFVWSFYDLPDAAAFFREAAEYLGAPKLAPQVDALEAYEALRQALPRDAAMLFVLDGLEKLQRERPDKAHIHGTLESVPLRSFLLWLAQAPVAARALITTRFSIPELAGEYRNERLRLLDIDTLTRPQARALLRRRGVNGSDPELDSMLERFGTHALTIDHLGGVIANFLDADARRFRELGEGALTSFAVGQTYNRLASVLAAYDGYLARDEPNVRETLQRVAIYTRPVSSHVLAAVVADAPAALPGGTPVNTEMELRRALRRLVDLHLIREERKDKTSTYTVHPAVREVVVAALGVNRVGIATAARKVFEAQLERRPGLDLRDQATVDLIEDLIFISIEEGRLLQALELYKERLGGYRSLGWRLGKYDLGATICRRLLETGRNGGVISKPDLYLVNADLALYLENLGRLDEALEHFSETLDFAAALAERPSVGVRPHNAAQAYLLAGRVPDAARIAADALAFGEKTRDREEALAALSWQGLAAFEGGSIPEAMERFGRCRQLQNEIEDNRWSLYSTRGFNFQKTLLGCGRADDALREAEASRGIHAGQSWQDSIARSDLIAAEALRLLGRPVEALDRLRGPREWAVAKGHQELVLYARLIGARLALGRGDLAVAREEAEDGLRTADTCGFGLFSVDLRNLIAALANRQKNADESLTTAKRALALAEDPQRNYFWGRLNAHETLAMTYHLLSNEELSSSHLHQAEALRALVHVSEAMLRPALYPSSQKVPP